MPAKQIDTLTDRQPSVLVMMATYNGEPFLRSQIESILSQRSVAVTLMIRDDGSQDATVAICEEYASRYPNVLFSQNETNQGVAQNFMGMVYAHESQGYDLYAFSDQDDSWYPHKLATAARELLAAERIDTPALYFSSIQNVWVDEQDRELRSEIEIAPFKGSEKAPLTLLVTNWVNGCAMVFNAKLYQLLNEYHLHEFPRYHDSWVHMVARFCGTVVADYDRVLSRRRITNSNTVGVTSFDVTTPKQLLHLLGLTFSKREHINERCAQLLLKGYRERIDPSYLRSIEDFATYRHSLSSRLRALFLNSYWLPSLQARIRIRVALLIGFY